MCQGNVGRVKTSRTIKAKSNQYGKQRHTQRKRTLRDNRVPIHNYEEFSYG